MAVNVGQYSAYTKKFKFMYAVIIYGLESYSLEGLFNDNQKEEALECAKEQQSNVDDIFYYGVKVYEGEGTNLSVIYHWTTYLS